MSINGQAWSSGVPEGRGRVPAHERRGPGKGRGGVPAPCGGPATAGWARRGLRGLGDGWVGTARAPRLRASQGQFVGTCKVPLQAPFLRSLKVCPSISQGAAPRAFFALTKGVSLYFPGSQRDPSYQPRVKPGGNRIATSMRPVGTPHASRALASLALRLYGGTPKLPSLSDSTARRRSSHRSLKVGPSISQGPNGTPHTSPG
jgi:hypothetical protein